MKTETRQIQRRRKIGTRDIRSKQESKIERKKVRNYQEFALFPVQNDEGNEDNVMVFYVKNLN